MAPRNFRNGPCHRHPEFFVWDLGRDAITCQQGGGNLHQLPDYLRGCGCQWWSLRASAVTLSVCKSASSSHRQQTGSFHRETAQPCSLQAPVTTRQLSSLGLSQPSGPTTTRWPFQQGTESAFEPGRNQTALQPGNQQPETRHS